MISLRSAAIVLVLLCGCGGENNSDPFDANTSPGVSHGSSPPSETSRPEKPLSLAEPAVPDKQFGEHDLSTEPVDALFGSARSHAAKDDYRAAARLQYWGVINSQRERGLYNLACYESQAGAIDRSLYWLQSAAELEGVDSEWATIDSDLTNVRNDPRWQVVLNYLQEFNRYWKRSGRTQTTLIVPADYNGRDPLPVIIGLHGMGDSPENFIDEDFQEDANQLNMAFVGVSGSVPIGPRKFVWSEDIDRDAQRIEDALAELTAEGRLTVADGARVLFGFSQGAVMSAEIAARNPEQYRGAIVLSPGADYPGTRIQQVQSRPAHQRQHYFCSVGAGEHPGNISLTRDYASQLRALGARVGHRTVRQQRQHTFPPDFWDQLSNWVRTILSDS